MKFTVVGAGAMGLRYGVLLKEAGNEVDFVDGWEPHVKKVQEQGGVLVKRDHKDEHLVPIKMYLPEDYNDTDQDVIIFFTKQMQLDDMLKRSKHFFTDKQYVLTCMNGMGHVEKILNYFSGDKVIAGTALIGTILDGPGVVDFIGKRGAGSMNMANYTEKPDEMTYKIFDELKKAQLNPNLTTNFKGTLMAKVIFNSVINTLCTMYEIRMGEYAAYPGSNELSKQLIDEAYHVCKLDGIKLISTPEEELNTVEVVSRDKMPLHYPSMYQDMSRNRPVEVDYINGYIVKLGKKYGYDAKTHRFLTHLVHLAEFTKFGK